LFFFWCFHLKAGTRVCFEFQNISELFEQWISSMCDFNCLPVNKIHMFTNFFLRRHLRRIYIFFSFVFIWSIQTKPNLTKQQNTERDKTFAVSGFVFYAAVCPQICYSEMPNKEFVMLANQSAKVPQGWQITLVRGQTLEHFWDSNFCSIHLEFFFF
jgi:hypothetical protein